jgi:replicative DNA helicase
MTLLAAIIISKGECLNQTWADRMPFEIFYIPRHRQLFEEMVRQHTQYGQFDDYTLRATFIEAQDFDMLTKTLNVLTGDPYGLNYPMPSFAHQYAQKLNLYRIRREKARATLHYLNKIKESNDPHGDRLELQIILDTLDSALHGDDAESDEDIARQLKASRYLLGFQDFDRDIGGVAAVGLNLIAARPSVGKSAFARAIIRNKAEFQKIFWYSQDQSKGQIYELEIARAARVNSAQVREWDEQKIVKSVRWIREKVWHGNVTLIDKPLNIHNLTSMINQALPQAVFIDYAQIIDAGFSEDYQNITAVSKAFKSLAFKHHIPVFALAQFNREHKDGYQPSLKWLKGSGQLEQDADTVIAIDRDTSQSVASQPATIFMLKNKVGPTGKVPLTWEGKYASFEDVQVGGFK